MGHRVVVVCSNEDEAHWKDLKRYLGGARAAGLAVVRGAHEIGDDDAMAAAIDEADVVIVLLTPAFVSSAQWEGAAMQRAKLAAEKHGTKVVPVVVKRCDYRHGWLGDRVALPRSGIAVCDHREGTSAAWVDVAAELRGLFTRQPPRIQGPSSAPRGPADGAPAATGPRDYSGVASAYRLLSHYHDALLRLVDATFRAAEGALGPLPESSWTPGLVMRPGLARRAASTPAERAPRAASGPIPLEQVTYVRADRPHLEDGARRVILVHDGTGGLLGQGSGAQAARASLGVFVTVVAGGFEAGEQPTPWETADAWLSESARGAVEPWEDGKAHLVVTRNGRLRVGGLVEDAAQVLGAASLAPWTARLSALFADAGAPAR